VLIAGLNDEHRTELTLDGLRVEGITPQQVHGHFATVTLGPLGPLGTNLDFSATDIKVMPWKPASGSAAAAKEAAFSCDGKFVPMQ
jgi:polygalacturonase